MYIHNQSISELSFVPVSRRVFVQNFSYENKFDLHENEFAGKTDFHMNDFALRLVLTPRKKENSMAVVYVHIF